VSGGQISILQLVTVVIGLILTSYALKDKESGATAQKIIMVIVVAAGSQSKMEYNQSDPFMSFYVASDKE
jgi:hypothetical protein